MQDVSDPLRLVLGLGLKGEEMHFSHFAVRALVVYVAAVLIVQLGKKRFMGQSTAFDMILGIMLGAVLSRAITGNAPFLPAIGAGAVLVAMHWLFSWIALHWHPFGELIRGKPRLMVRNGQVDDDAMRRTHLSEHDLWEDLRGQGVSKLEEVAEARLERSGRLSVIKASAKPRIVEIRVEAGVQTVRVGLV